MTRQRIVETPEAETARYMGWAEIARALGVSKRAARRASLRRDDPLRVRVDPFGRPWIYASRLKAWVQDNDRSMRQHVVEQRCRAAETALGALTGEKRRATQGETVSQAPRTSTVD